MSGLSYLFNGRFRADPFPHLREYEGDPAPEGSEAARAAILKVQQRNMKPTPQSARIPRVIPSRRR